MALKRMPSVVLNQLVQTEQGQVFCKVPCRIQVPTRFADRGLAQVGTNTFVYGSFPIILDSGEYAVVNVCALIEISPFKITKTTLAEEEYYEFYFEANSVVIKTTEIVQRDAMMYNVFDEFIFKGKVPWYLGYDDMCKLFDTADFAAGSNVAELLEVIEFIASMVTRSKADRSKFIRNVAKTYADFANIANIDYVPLNSIFYSVNSTMNKLSGNYFDNGVRSSLVTTTTQVNKIEAIIRA